MRRWYRGCVPLLMTYSLPQEHDGTWVEGAGRTCTQNTLPLPQQRASENNEIKRHICICTKVCTYPVTHFCCGSTSLHVDWVGGISYNIICKDIPQWSTLCVGKGEEGGAWVYMGEWVREEGEKRDRGWREGWRERERECNRYAWN